MAMLILRQAQDCEMSLTVTFHIRTAVLSISSSSLLNYALSCAMTTLIFLSRTAPVLRLHSGLNKHNYLPWQCLNFTGVPSGFFAPHQQGSLRPIFTD